MKIIGTEIYSLRLSFSVQNLLYLCNSWYKEINHDKKTDNLQWSQGENHQKSKKDRNEAFRKHKSIKGNEST